MLYKKNEFNRNYKIISNNELYQNEINNNNNKYS
jgi:hypothetical protein